ncbi:MAG: hypothetical protein IBJ11_08820 [Phycisphaerales bacterium]|nr:hypothetical protein [Phycisphaerales bacterium]
MKKTLSAFAVVAIAGSASAASLTVPTSVARPIFSMESAGVMISAQPIDTRGDAGRSGSGVVYAGIPGPYSAFAATTGALGFDDYNVNVNNPNPTLPDLDAPPGRFNLSAIRFVGGVTAANGVLFFDYFDSGGNFVNGFGVQLPSAGDFIWTITLAPATIQVATSGFMQITANTGTNGRWFFTTTAPTVGGNAIGTGTGAGLTPQRYNAFELSIPSAGTGALFGLAGLVGLRRRRSA